MRWPLILLVVGVVVLVLLLALMTGYCAGCDNTPRNPDVAGLVKRISQHGSGLEVQASAKFVAGTRIYAPAVIPEQGNAFTFSCADAAFCAGSPLEVSEHYITVKENATGAIAVCTGDGEHYFVVVGSSIQETRDYAVNVCGLG